MTVAHMKALAVLIVEYTGSPSTPFHLAISANAKALVMGLEKLEKELLKMQEDVGDVRVDDHYSQKLQISLDDRFETILQGETNDLPSD